MNGRNGWSALIRAWCNCCNCVGFVELILFFFCLLMHPPPPDPRIHPAAWRHLKPHVRELLGRIQRKPRPPMESLPVDLARDAYALGSHVLEVTTPALPRVEQLRIPNREAHSLPARLYAPQAREAGRLLPVLVFFHGGGFVVGSIDTHDTLCRVLCQQSGCAVLSVDYRLAPEHKFPAAFNDAWDAVHWLTQTAHTLGLDASRMAVGGDSAGGTLAAACAVQAAQQSVPLRLQLLFYPGMQAEPVTPSRQLYAEGFLLTEPQIQWMFAQCVQHPGQYQDWRFAPIHTEHVEGVAPLWMGLAECDPICDDSMLWADKLRAAGVPVELELYHGVIHEFIKMGRAIPEGLQAHRDAAAALRRALQP